MKYKLAIFDMDGTTLNSLSDLATSLNFALTQAGFPTRSTEEVRKFIGNGIKKLVERGVPLGTESKKTEEVFLNFCEYYKDHCSDETKPFDGIITLFNNLRNKKIKIAINSNKKDFAVQKLCKTFFPNLIDIAVGETSFMKKKPAPDSVFYILKKLNFEPKEAIYIGDSDVDILTAKNSNLDCISVCWGFRTKEELKKSGGSIFVSKPSEIEELIF